MTRILATIGPASEGKNLNKFLQKSDVVRLNMSHNSIDLHKKIINKIKKRDKKKTILVDIPGVKPRTLNSKILKIKIKLAANEQQSMPKTHTKNNDS